MTWTFKYKKLCFRIRSGAQLYIQWKSVSTAKSSHLLPEVNFKMIEVDFYENVNESES